MLYIGKNIKVLRTEKKLSQARLASQLGIVPGTISNYENGVSAPDFEILEKLIKILGVSAQELLYEDLSGKSFNSKTPKNVRDENPNENPIKNPNIPKLQKTLGYDEGNFNSKTPKNATLMNGGEKGGKKGGIPKLQKTPPLNEDNSPIETDSDSEVIREQENVFTGMTDKEVLDIIEEGFEAHLMEMYEAGRAVPAVTVQQYKEDIKELTTQVARLEYENKELRLKLDAVTGRPRGKKATETGKVDTGKGTQKKSL